MSSGQIISLLIAGINTLLAIFVLGKNPKSISNRYFSLFTFSVTFWGIGLLMTQMTGKMIWAEITFAFGILMGLSFVLFSYVFPRTDKKIPLYVYIIFLIPAVLFLGLLPSGSIIKGFQIIGDSLKPELGPLYGFFMSYVVLSVIYGIGLLIIRWRRATGITKMQFRYLGAGFALFSMGAVLTNIILPAIGIYQFNNLGPSLSITVVIFTAYSITRYRLMNLRLVLGKSAVYLLSFCATIVLIFIFTYFLDISKELFVLNTTSVSILILSMILLQFILGIGRKFAAKYFYSSFYNYQGTLTELGRKLTQVLDIDLLSDLFSDTLSQTMKLDRIVVLLKDAGGNYRIQKNIGFDGKNGISLVRNNFLTDYLEATQNLLSYEELSLIIKEVTDLKKKNDLQVIKTNMERIEAMVCLPLLIEKKMIGMIVLGNKASRDPYSKEDFDLLTNLMNQASVALQNAKLFSQVKDLSQNLQEKVDEQTKELKDAYDELKRLDQAKSEFISIASHQLRTPLAAIKGYISMILDGSYGVIETTTKNTLIKVSQANERLVKIVNDLLNLSRIEGGRMKFEPQLISLEKLIEGAINIFKIEAQKKGLTLKFQKPKIPLPKIMVDQEKLDQAIFNLIDNAIHYTENGSIAISAEVIKNKDKESGSKALIRVQDTGRGMETKELGALFEKFSRGKEAGRFWTEGTGLGLFVARKFVEIHRGRIWAESEGEGKGSTFIIELPIN